MATPRHVENAGNHAQLSYALRQLNNSAQLMPIQAARPTIFLAHAEAKSLTPFGRNDDLDLIGLCRQILSTCLRATELATIISQLFRCTFGCSALAPKYYWSLQQNLRQHAGRSVAALGDFRQNVRIFNQMRRCGGSLPRSFCASDPATPPPPANRRPRRPRRTRSAGKAQNSTASRISSAVSTDVNHFHAGGIGQAKPDRVTRVTRLHQRQSAAARAIAMSLAALTI